MQININQTRNLGAYLYRYFCNEKNGFHRNIKQGFTKYDEKFNIRKVCKKLKF